MNELLGLAGFAFVGSITPGPNNALLLASGIRFGLAGPSATWSGRRWA